MIRLIIADDHAIIRQGLRALIEKSEDVRVVAECPDGASALDAISVHKPDIAILDISMPEIDGLTLAAKLAKLQLPTRLIILTTHEDPALYEKAFNLGVYGYVLKNNAFEQLLSTIRDVASGINTMTKPANNAHAKTSEIMLTDREREVLGLIAHGLTNRMISESLAISIKTVDNHRTNLMMKLRLHSVAELIRFAYQTGLT